MEYTTFLPDRTLDIVNSNGSPEGIGIVNDYNCRYLGGVAGNAGLFSCLRDIMRYVRVLISEGEPLFSRDILLEAIKNQTIGMSVSRGLGFVYADEKHERTGSLLPVGSVGHGGNTGQLVFADVKSGLYSIILSDLKPCVYKKYGGKDYTNIHNKVMSDINTAIKKDIGDTEITAVFADHTVEAFGLIVKAEGNTLYFSGDTLYSEKLFEIAKYRPDITFICINGRLGNMNVNEALVVAKKIGAKLNVPNHYDMFASNSKDPHLFADNIDGGFIMEFDREYQL